MRKYLALDAYDLNWRTVKFAYETMRQFAIRARVAEGDPELIGAAKALEEALEHVQNYYLPLVEMIEE